MERLQQVEVEVSCMHELNISSKIYAIYK